MEINSCVPHAITERLKGLEYRVYNSVYVTVMTSGLTHSYGPNTHKLCIIRGIRVTSPQGDNVKVAFTVYANNAVEINSNIDLNGSTLMIF